MTSVTITMVDRLEDSPYGGQRVPTVSTCIPLREVHASLERAAWRRSTIRQTDGHRIAESVVHDKAFQCRTVRIELTPLLYLGGPFLGADGACMTTINVLYVNTC